MQHNAIAIFVKTPSLSPVKTRLANSIGENKAREFYHLCLTAVLETARGTDAKIYWAVSEKGGLEDNLWAEEDRLWTGDGGLGEQQNQVYATLREYHHNVMLLGIDCPQLTPQILQTAFEKLKHYNFVIGPARDGGYTLLAGRHFIPKQAWTSVSYSSANTFQELRSQLAEPVFDLPAYTDIDQQEDLVAMLEEMPDAPSEAQQKIIEWSRNYEDSPVSVHG